MSSTSEIFKLADKYKVMRRACQMAGEKVLKTPKEDLQQRVQAALEYQVITEKAMEMNKRLQRMLLEWRSDHPLEYAESLHTSKNAQ